ncbi:MAG: insulinase family protein [Saprospiraceae bacterium]|nr:insulinase family protein [Saprospiraceae bacterium]
MINRKIGPGSHRIESLFIPEMEIYTLENGVKVCEVNLGSQDVIKIEVVHLAGRVVEECPLTARAVSSLIKDGCGHKTSAQVAEEIDYFGSSIKTGSNMDFSYSTVYSLTKYGENIIPLLHDMYYQPVFPEEEIQKFKHLNIQKLKEELSKNEVITYRHITEEIFGKNHAYGYNSQEEDYINLNYDNIYSHYINHYGSDNCYIFVSGKINDRIRYLISEYFGTVRKPAKQHRYEPCTQPVTGKKIRLTSKNEHQSAIKTGRKLFDKNHPDNAAFFVMNTILGGYFGSRLMTRIREELGYTYDIDSSIDQMLYDGCFYISTEAASEYVEPILKESYHQMHLLKDEKVQETEISMVKNYLMGNFMNMLDGPMNVASFAKSMILTNKHPKEFQEFVGQMLETGAEQIMDVAQRYLNIEKFTEVVVEPQ